jgi:ATP-dependent exoDNAse (exonuclease V) beta subunit
VKPHGQSLLASLWPAVAAEQEPLIIRAAESLDQAVDTAAEELTEKTALPASYYRLSPQWQAPDAPMSVQQTRAMYADTRDAIEFSWAGEDARHTGNLVHRLLQWVGENGRVQWENKGGMAAHENWCRQRLACEGITADLADGVIQRVSLAMERCLASTQGRWILQDHEDAHCEYAIIAVMDNKPPKKMVLDRTFVENGIRWIIDYKTSSHTGGDLEAFLENERRRYAEQLEAYARALALTETLPIRTALYFPLLDRLVLVDST